MGTRETRFAARVADLIGREGNDCTIAGTAFKGITDEDPENLRTEVPALLETATGRITLLHVTGSDFTKIEAASGQPIIFDGERWTPHPARKISANGVTVEVVVPCVSGAL